MENILTKEITIKKVFEVRLLILSKIKQTTLVIHNNKTDNFHTYTLKTDLPDVPHKYQKLDKEIDDILTSMGLEMSEEEKYDLYRDYSDIITEKSTNQLTKAISDDDLYKEIKLIIDQADTTKYKQSTLGSVIKSYTTHYLYDQLEELISLDLIQKPCLIRVDFHELEEYMRYEKLDFALHKRLDDVQNQLEKTIKKEFHFKYPEVAFVDMEKNVSLNFIGSEHIGKTVTFEGTITKLSKKFPALKNAVYQCKNCMRMISIEQKGLIPTQPVACPECNGRSFSLIEDECEYKDAHMMELEEIPELRQGTKAASILAKMEGLLVNPNKPLNLGDNITVTGVVNATRNEKSRKNEFSLDIYNYTNNKSNQQDMEVTPEDIEVIEKLSNDPMIIDKLRDSILPFIHGHSEVKRGLIIQLFSGELETKPKMRTGINILLVGDPGVAKSRMGKHIVEITPKSQYVEGTGTTKAGLVGDVSYDSVYSNGWTFTIGSILQANQGLLVMDEIDKADKDIIVSLNECTSQGSVTISKAGARESFDTNTNVLAMGNPKYSSFRDDKTLWEQCSIIDPTTLTRFHLIYAMHDEVVLENDKAIMDSMLRDDDLVEQEISDELLNKYIAYAKTNINPVFTSESRSILSDYYANIRSESNKSQLGKPLTPRDGEALRNIAKSIARIRLSDTVSVSDSKKAIEVYNEALKTVDLDINTAGALRGIMSKEEKEQEHKAFTIVKECFQVWKDEYGLSDELPSHLRKDYEVSLMVELGWEKEEAQQYLRDEINELIILDNRRGSLD